MVSRPRPPAVTTEFVDRGAARQRLGLLVVPYLNGEGKTNRYVINADRFVVAAPDGGRIVNEPAGATVGDGRAVWTGVAATEEDRAAAWQAPQPGNTYVITGSGATAGARSTAVTTLEPLDPGLYGRYGLGLLFVVLATYGIYRLQGTRLPRRSVAGGIALAALPYVAGVAAIHPWWPAGIGALAWPLLGIAVALAGGPSAAAARAYSTPPPTAGNRTTAIPSSGHASVPMPTGHHG